MKVRRFAIAHASDAADITWAAPRTRRDTSGAVPVDRARGAPTLPSLLSPDVRLSSSGAQSVRALILCNDEKFLRRLGSHRTDDSVTGQMRSTLRSVATDETAYAERTPASHPGHFLLASYFPLLACTQSLLLLLCRMRFPSNYCIAPFHTTPP
jgi:hypothetical protein